jgi:hypothetical protein
MSRQGPAGGTAHSVELLLRSFTVCRDVAYSKKIKQYQNDRREPASQSGRIRADVVAQEGTIFLQLKPLFLSASHYVPDKKRKFELASVLHIYKRRALNWARLLVGKITMTEENKTEKTEGAQKTRRAIVTSAAQVAVTAPAVGLLLSASTLPAAAQTLYQAQQNHILDDYTFGNDREDIDALGHQTNTNPLTGAPEQDDVYNPPA